MSEYSRYNECDSVPIKVNRVFDSCSDKDCVTGVPVVLTSPLPDNITIIKSKCITVCDVCMSVEPIPFNKGFYSVDLTFTFDVQLLGYATGCSCPVPIKGTAKAVYFLAVKQIQRHFSAMVSLLAQQVSAVTL